MVKITNGVNTFVVTKGAFDGIYSRRGYHLCVEPVEQAEVPCVGEQPVVDETAAFCETIEEKPISQWNKQEIKRYAEIKGIDIAGTKNAGEAKELIKAFWDAAE